MQDLTKRQLELLREFMDSVCQGDDDIDDSGNLTDPELAELMEKLDRLIAEQT